MSTGIDLSPTARERVHLPTAKAGLSVLSSLAFILGARVYSIFFFFFFSTKQNKIDTFIN